MTEVHEALLWITGLVAAALGAAVALFRRGGAYNPVDNSVDSGDSEDIEPEPKPAPTPVSEPTEPSKDDLIERMIAAIEDFEGYEPGLPAYRNKNPGNLKKVDGTFFKFATYDEGRAALRDYILRSARGQHKAYKPEMSLMEYFHIYTADKEPAPTNYAKFVAARMKVDVHNFKLKELA
jgi:hypothetical protein